MILARRALNLKAILVYVIFALVFFVVVTNAHAQESDLFKILEQAETQKAKAQDVAEHVKLKELRSIIGSDSAETNHFLQRLFASDYQGAVLAFSSAVNGTAFEKSNGAKALYGFLLWQNGLKLEGLERLTAIEDLQTIAPLILDFWRPMVKTDSREWKIVKIKVSDSWGAFFGSSSYKDQARMWQESTIFAVNDEIDKAAKLLGVIAKEPDSYVEKDLINLTASRMLYQRGFLDAAIRYDNMITRNSDLWPVAQEEAAWAHMRKGEMGKALAITRSLIHTKLRREVGPETLFLHAFLNLKVCNYPEVNATLKSYKERFRPRVIELQKVADNAPAAQGAIKAALTLAEKSQLRPVTLGAHSSMLPRDSGFDRQLKQDGLIYGVLKDEEAAAVKLHTLSIEKSASAENIAEYESIKNKAQARAEASRHSFVERTQALAKNEIKEIAALLQKMHIVEAEVIQQTGFSQKVAVDTSKASKKPKVVFDKIGKDQVRFAGDGEIWFDELNHYQVQASASCKGKTL